MRYPILLLLLIFLSSCNLSFNQDSSNHKNYYIPDQHLGVLFSDVQRSGMFPDDKTFVDAEPLYSPSEIVEKYQVEKNSHDFELKEFVQDNFQLPTSEKDENFEFPTSMEEHLGNHWKRLTKSAADEGMSSTLISLPKPYVVPGGRFREMFYWDSYFTIEGLLVSNEDSLVHGMLDNFQYLIEEFGHIPNANRTYFISRSQPPFFAFMLRAYADKHGWESVIKYLPALEKEYQYWMEHEPHNLTDKSYRHLVKVDSLHTLNRYYSELKIPRAEAYSKETRWAFHLDTHERSAFHQHIRAACESGWDFSSRWFKDQENIHSIYTMDIVPVCLNSLLYHLEHTLSEMHYWYGHPEEANHYMFRADLRKELINTFMWDSKSGLYRDYDFKLQSFTPAKTLATVYPLFCKMASPEQAERVCEIIESEFLKDGGVVTTLIESGEQWDAPNGWAPLQWMTVKGLLNYGYDELAMKIASNWLNLNRKVYQSEHKMMEKYNVVNTNLKAGGGEYPNQDGFGWTNGIALILSEIIQQQSNSIVEAEMTK
ncbi:alpha,alpha-trehalase TreF [Sediminitomix flava]|uniref:Alpha,alpha-trehalase n=1 Tax=Sediminitomix flava TaxID=379075 RepID=A0A315ZFX2_SEDFL|nr:alpha,alpha-trehalase TreF [Sediminitomix flava]PWJ44486.1 alpha,alpha-trehalase [Sediminitomix flava]